MTYDTIDDGESTPLLEEGGLSVDGTSNVTTKTGPRYSKRCRTLLGIIAAVATTTTAAVAFLTTHHSSRAAGVQNPIISTLSSVLGTGRKRGESCDNIWWNACGPGLSCFTGGHSGSGKYCVPMGKEGACCGFWDDDEARAPGIDCEPGLSCHWLPCPDCGTDICVKNNNSRPNRFARNGSCNVNDGTPATEFVTVDCESIP